ncbi:glycosyl hydrolase family 28-related protein, partial [Enterobacter hormaechei]|uniref:glycosyl hydrolase family 28-related protein n=2 Tax=Enterobacter hormaechei TaxID=158836 RepID=UPI0013DFD5D2
MTDDTAAINAACSSLAGASLITNFRRLYFPHGTYIYNGSGIVLPNGSSLIGEDLFTTIDASANTNTGYLITLTGFRSRVDTIALKGNKDNPGMVGISSYYNSDNGGVLNCILED